MLVTGDRDRLKQVLVNLVGNAIQYTPAGGKVTLSLQKTDEQARLIVSDTGPAFPLKTCRTFSSVFTAASARANAQAVLKASGFGLGLSIAYWIMRNHGGNIEVNSSEGQGTTFCVWLPIHSATKPPETRTA